MKPPYESQFLEIIELFSESVQNRVFSHEDYYEIRDVILEVMPVFNVSISLPDYLFKVVFGDAVDIETPMRRLNAVYAIMELDDLIVSHNEESFSQNRYYPEHCQQRAYHYDALERYKVEIGATELNLRFLIADTPTATDGAPMVNKDGIVLGGNGRTMMLKRARRLKNEGYKNYVETIRNKKLLSRYGIHEDIHDFISPVLVRVLKNVDMDDCALYSNILNTDYKQSIDIQTKTISYARQFDKNLINLLSTIFSESEKDETLKHFLSDPPKAIRLRNILEKAGIITNQNKSDFIDISTTIFSEQGKIALESILLSIVLTEKQYIEAARSFTMTILAALPQLLTIQGLPADFNITQNIKDAIMLEYSRRTNAMTKKALLKRIKSGNLFGDIKPPSELTEVVWDILTLGQKKFRTLMSHYGKQVEEQVSGNNMFMENRDALTILKELFTMQKKKQGLSEKNLLEENNGFHSRLKRAVDNLPDKGVKAKSLINTLKKSKEGVSQTEIDLYGLDKFILQHSPSDSVAKDVLQKMYQKRKIKIIQTVLYGKTREDSSVNEGTIEELENRLNELYNEDVREFYWSYYEDECVEVVNEYYHKWVDLIDRIEEAIDSDDSDMKDAYYDELKEEITQFLKLELKYPKEAIEYGITKYWKKDVNNLVSDIMKFVKKYNVSDEVGNVEEIVGFDVFEGMLDDRENLIKLEVSRQLKETELELEKLLAEAEEEKKEYQSIGVDGRPFYGQNAYRFLHEGDYYEVLFQLKTKPILYESSHFDEYGRNLLGHFRCVHLSSENLLFIEEIQSDWTQSIENRESSLFPSISKFTEFCVKAIILFATQTVKSKKVFWTSAEIQNKRNNRYYTQLQELEWKYLEQIDRYRITITDIKGSKKEDTVRKDMLLPYFGKEVSSEILKKSQGKLNLSPDMFYGDKGNAELYGSVDMNSFGIVGKAFEKIIKPLGGNIIQKRIKDQIVYGFEIPEKLQEEILQNKTFSLMDSMKKKNPLSDTYDDELKEILDMYSEAVKRGIFSEEDVLEINAVLAGVLPLFDVQYQMPEFKPSNQSDSTKKNDESTNTVDEQTRRIEAAKERTRIRKETRQRNELFISGIENDLKNMQKQHRKNNYPGFFPTPEPIILEMIGYLNLNDGDRVLEPSAGAGAIADLVLQQHPFVLLDCVEFNQSLRELLEAKGHTIVGDDFLQYSPDYLYDAIIMNPPFEKLADVFHVQYAYNLLKPGGRLAAIMSESVFFRADELSASFRDFIGLRGTAEKLPEGSFKESDTMVNTRIVLIEKPLEEYDDIKEIETEYLSVKNGTIVESLISGTRYVVINVTPLALQQLNTIKIVNLDALRADEYEIISQEQIDAENNEQQKRQSQARNHRRDGLIPRESEHAGAGGSRDISTERRQGSSEWEKRKPILIRPEFTDRIPEEEIERFCQEHIEVNCRKAFDYQLEGVLKGFRALNSLGGFINADGPGVGKTVQILLLAYAQAKKSQKPAIIVTLSKDIIRDSFKQASTILNIPFRAWTGETLNYNSNKIYICTYHDFISKKCVKNKTIQVPSGTNEDGSIRYYEKTDIYLNIEPENISVAIFDESHKLINEDTGWTKQGLYLIEYAQSVAYFSATPLDKVSHILYLKRAGLYKTRRQFYDLMWHLGFEERCRTFYDQHKNPIQKCNWVLRKHVPREVMAIALENLFDDLTEDGAMIKREYDLSNMSMEVLKIKLPDIVASNLNAIRMAWMAEAVLRAKEKRSTIINFGNFAGVIMQEQIRETEQYKIRDVVKLADRELKDGRSVVIFANQVNEGTVIVKGLNRTRIGTFVELKKIFKERGIPFVELTGNISTAQFETNVQLFQTNKVRLALVSPGKGATGINLDDITGHAPRTMLVMTYPQTARLFVQMCGRINRATTKSAPKVIVLVGNVRIEETLQAILVTKMFTLSAAVSGSVSSLLEENEQSVEQENDSEENPLWVYFEGVQNLVDGRKRYAVWAKKLHPDTSGYDSAAEFREMNTEYQAWQEWMNTYKKSEQFHKSPHADKKKMDGKKYGVAFNAQRTVYNNVEYIIIKSLRGYDFGGSFLREAKEKGFIPNSKYRPSELMTQYSPELWEWTIGLFETKKPIFESDDAPLYEVGTMVMAAMDFTDNGGSRVQYGHLGIVKNVRERATSPTTSTFFYDVDWIIPTEAFSSLREKHKVVRSSKRVHKDDLYLAPARPDEVDLRTFVDYEYLRQEIKLYSDGSGGTKEYIYHVYDFEKKEYVQLPEMRTLNMFAANYQWVIEGYMKDVRFSHIEDREIRLMRIITFLKEQLAEEASGLWHLFNKNTGVSDTMKIEEEEINPGVKKPAQENNGFYDLNDVLSARTTPIRLNRTRTLFGRVNFPCHLLLWGLYGGGKSTLSLYFMEDILLQDAKVLYVMSEEKQKTGRLGERIERAKVDLEGVIFNDTLNYQSLRELLDNNPDLKYIVIDSVSMLRYSDKSKAVVKEDDVLSLMDDYDDRSFIFIVHSVKDDSTYRGFPRLANMVDTVVHVTNGVAVTKKHRDAPANKEMIVYGSNPTDKKERKKMVIKGLVV